MLVFQTKVDCQGQMMFKKNHAMKGGAVTLEDQSLVSRIMYILLLFFLPS